MGYQVLPALGQKSDSTESLSYIVYSISPKRTRNFSWVGENQGQLVGEVGVVSFGVGGLVGKNSPTGKRI